MTLLQTELEARCPLTIRRLALFSTKQAQMSFSDFVALVKKKAETADTSSMNTDNILSYIVLSGCNDNDILEDILKYQKNPSFEEIVRIGTNLEVSRSIVHALPGSQYPQNKTFKVTGKKIPKRCQRCGSYRHQRAGCHVDEEVRCFKCGEEGHLSYICQEEDQEEDRESGKDDENSKEDAENQESDEDSTEAGEEDDDVEEVKEDEEEEEEERDERFQIKDKKRRSKYRPVSRY